MAWLISLVQEGGPLLLVVLVGGSLLPLLAGPVFVAQLLRWRLPQGIIVALISTVVGVGFVGTVLVCTKAYATVQLASPSFADRLAAGAYFLSILPGSAAAGLGALGCCFAALGNGFGLLVRPGEKPVIEWGAIAMGIGFGLVSIPLMAWTAGGIGAVVAALIALAFLSASARSPHETDADRARSVTGRVVVGSYGALAFSLVLVEEWWWAQGLFHHAAANAAPEQVQRLQAAAVDDDQLSLMITGCMAVACLLWGLILASSKFGDLDGRAWAQGGLFVVPPLFLVPPAVVAAYALGSLASFAQPWQDTRLPVLSEVGLRPPRLDIDFLDAIVRSDTLQFVDGVQRWNDAPAPASLPLSEMLNIEAGPDASLGLLAARTTKLAPVALCLTVRSFGRLSCLPFRIAGSEEAEQTAGLLVKSVAPHVQLVPDNHGWVLLDLNDTVLARGSIEQVAEALPKGTIDLRVWFPEGRTVEDLVALQKSLVRLDDIVLNPFLVWRTDSAPNLLPHAKGLEVLGLPRADVQRVLTRNQGVFDSCIEAAQRRRPGLVGSFNVSFSIGAPGSVLAARVHDSNVKDATLERCVESRIRGIRFPKPSGGRAEVVFPVLVSQPTDSDAP